MAPRSKYVMTVQDTARTLGVSERTVYNWVYQNKIEAYELPGGGWRIPLRTVAKLVGLTEQELERCFSAPIAFSALTIKDVKSSDGRKHVVQGGLDDGMSLFTDREFTALQVPDMFKGTTYIQTAYDCKLVSNLELTFTVTAWCHVYVCPRQGVVELDWLKEGYELLPETMMYRGVNRYRVLRHRVLEIWRSKKKYAPGNTVTTYETNSEDTFYFVFAVITEAEL